MNLPLESERYDARFCDSVKGCVVVKIKDFVNILKNPNANGLDKRQSLRFVIHLVADIHQPFHVADNGDRGGTRLQIRYLGLGTNLHAAWDFGILQSDARKAGGELDEDLWVTRLSSLPHLAV